MFESWPLLSLVIWTPIIGGVVVLATGGDRNATEARVLALIVSVLTFALSIPLFTEFKTGTAAMQFIEYFNWMSLGDWQLYYPIKIK